ncbi:hypothetical protein CSUB01_10165 [Colletotrichum sublineola]|uniref:Uncharacterized protein n=1 Tax=Colletotrichum sublineola TaxID=1173701 RepID=A0A066X2H8_COLSU|nr:hypothetical protein CSUB01_10165 [Colletotrichum sublineola]
MASQRPGRRVGQAHDADAVETFGHMDMCPLADGLQQLTACRVLFAAVRDDDQPGTYRRCRGRLQIQPRRKPLGDDLYTADIVGKKADHIGKREKHAVKDAVARFHRCGREGYAVRGRHWPCYQFMTEHGLPRPPGPFMGGHVGVGNQDGSLAGHAVRGQSKMDLAVTPGCVGPGDVYSESLHGDPLGRTSYQHECTWVLAVRTWQTVQQSLGTVRTFDDIGLVFL